MKYDAENKDFWKKIELPDKATKEYVCIGVKASNYFMPKDLIPWGGGSSNCLQKPRESRQKVLPKEIILLSFARPLHHALALGSRDVRHIFGAKRCLLRDWSKLGKRLWVHGSVGLAMCSPKMDHRIDKGGGVR